MPETRSFSIRDLLAQLPNDGATRLVKIGGVNSTMSHDDICELLRVPAAERQRLRWEHCCPILRTDFVVELATVDDARRCVQSIQRGITFLNAKLTASFVASWSEAANGSPYSATQFDSEPRLYYALASQNDRDVDARLAEAKRLIGQAPLKQKSWWVDERKAV